MIDYDSSFLLFFFLFVLFVFLQIFPVLFIIIIIFLQLVPLVQIKHSIIITQGNNKSLPFILVTRHTRQKDIKIYAVMQVITISIITYQSNNISIYSFICFHCIVFDFILSFLLFYSSYSSYSLILREI